jgi:hypothetical protein
VVAADLLFQGEFLPADAAPAKNRKVANPRQFAGYTYGYNHSLFAERVHDVLTLAAYCKGHQEATPDRVHLIGVQGAGPIVAAAAALAGESVDRVAVDTAGFRFTTLVDFDDANFLPGAAKYGDLPAMLALCAPHKMWLAGEGEQTHPLVAGAYAAAGVGDGVTTYRGDKPAAAAVDWLLSP